MGILHPIFNTQMRNLDVLGRAITCFYMIGVTYVSECVSYHYISYLL